jgi:hypothetical protein
LNSPRPRASALPTTRRALLALSALAASASGLVLPALAESAPPPNLRRGIDVEDTSRLISRSFTGDIPNGPSRNAVISQDERIGRVIAFESDASDIVAGDSNAATDVFAVTRAPGYGPNGDDWFPGRTELISRALGGGPANGPSYRPAVNGEAGSGGVARSAPTCVAFISRASNLVPRDTNGRADAFVRDLRTGRTTRVSVDSRGRQANGDSHEVTVNGDCTRVAFSSSATNLALTRARKRGQQAAATRRPAPATTQVYVRVLNRPRGRERDLGRTTFLASASSSGRAGNGHSTQPAFATQAGKALAFTSTATNLAAADRTSTSDVYERLMPNGASPKRFKTRLVSVASSGQAGNGPSSAPAINGNGREIAYETQASNILPGDGNGFSDIVRAKFGSGSRPSIAWASRSAQIGPGNGPSYDPAISDAGAFVIFESDADNYVGPRDAPDDADLNARRDVFLWTELRGIVWLESQGSRGAPLSFPSENPVTSARGNYVLFETRDPFVDVELVRRLHPDWEGARASVEGRAAAEGGFHQIYLRWVGPK